MFGKKTLKKNSKFCAYCNKALSDKEKTIDHIVPLSFGGVSELKNMVVSCIDCNAEKSNTNFISYVYSNEKRQVCFANYLKTMDDYDGFGNYSSLVLKNIRENIVLSKKKKKKCISEEKSVEYYIRGLNYSFTLTPTPTQSKVLDYCINNSKCKDYKVIAKELGIKVCEITSIMSQINNLTGFFILNNVRKNGIERNKLYKKHSIEKIQKQQKNKCSFLKYFSVLLNYIK